MGDVRLHSAPVVWRFGMYAVEPIWTNVDRPSTGGWSMGDRLDLAERLSKAIEAGAVFDRYKVKIDVNGRSYVEAHDRLPSRPLEECLANGPPT